ncbi:YbjN domain-containing protein [Paenibacillus sp. TRM 82003]|nr:YbjN domain-containing protein [Paenibacillus sp. TRM 82003]
MSEEQRIHARDQAELGFLQQYLREYDLPSELIKPSNEIPIGTLLVPLMQDELGRDRYVTFNFVPLSEEEAEHIRLLQIYSVVPVEWKDGAKGDVERLLHEINARTAVGHFGMKPDGEIHLRYAYAATASSILPKHEIIGVLELFHMMLDLFSETIDGVASGRMSLAQALENLQ